MNDPSKQNAVALAALDSQSNLVDAGNTFGDELANIQQTIASSQYMKVPTTELASLGSAFSAFPACFRTMQQTISTSTNPEGLFRCVFPNGVSGTLMEAKDGSGALGAISKSGGGLAQARWIPAGGTSVTSSISTVLPVDPTTVFIAIAIMGLCQKLDAIQAGQKEIAASMERDKRCQLLADLDILAEYSADYKYVWNNKDTTRVNLNQVKDIKRNALKEIKVYKEQTETLAADGQKLAALQNASAKVAAILDNFAHYKLAQYVFALSSYLEVMFAKNFNADYLNKVSATLREQAFDYLQLYTKCYDHIETITTGSAGAHIAKGLAKASKVAGSAIAKIPLVNKTPVDEALAGASEGISTQEQKRLKKTMDTFIRYKDSGIPAFAKNIDLANKLYNEPVDLLWGPNAIYLRNESGTDFAG